MDVVIGLVYYGNNFLIGKKRECEHPQGLGGEWHILGGKVEDDESREEALQREFMEEVNLGVTIEQLLDEVVEKSTWKGKASTVRITWYLCKALNQEVKLSNEIIDYKWIPKNEVLSSIGEHALSIVQDNVKKFLTQY